MKIYLSLCLMMLPTALWAGAVDYSYFPRKNPFYKTTPVVEIVDPAPVQTEVAPIKMALGTPQIVVRPKRRPSTSTYTPIAQREAPREVAPAARAEPVRSMRVIGPKRRPSTLKPAARTRQASVTPNANPIRVRKISGSQGRVCGDRGIIGQKAPSIKGKMKGCGVRNPVRVTSVDGVLLSQPSLMDCNTAKTLKKWVNKGAKPAVGRLGGGLRSIKIVAHYSCRTRNSQRGAKISEHGKGKAVDIAAFGLKNGKTITVLKGWNNKHQGKILRRMHKTACGPFGTVLGPKANRFHLDHFHFDTAKHRGGSYCR
ncbi:MAG: extensin family protein [Halocynthiibacter sp.]